jgi:hypothetical protein
MEWAESRRIQCRRIGGTRSPDDSAGKRSPDVDPPLAGGFIPCVTSTQVCLNGESKKSKNGEPEPLC